MQSTNGSLRITVLGSGTSVGVPTIGCHCAVCSSEDPRDKRLRPSIYVRYRDRGVLVDTSPDFRNQALSFGIDRLDAILYTHAHADHIMGLDDVRPFNFHQNAPIPIYGSEETLAIIQRVFTYIFDGTKSQSSRPMNLKLRTLKPKMKKICSPMDWNPNQQKIPLLTPKKKPHLCKSSEVRFFRSR